MKKIRKTKFQIFRFLSLIACVICAIVLIVESCLNGKISSDQSNAVGGTIAGIVNDLKGDQSKAIEPTSLKIDNKKSSFYVGEEYDLEITLLPLDTTYKSLTYVSSNEDVAHVSSDGKITFLKEGNVNIEVSNSHFPKIKDSFSVDVSNIDVQEFNVSINATVNQDVYYIDLDETDYYVDYEILPNNATFKNVSFSLDNDEFISIKDDGKITPLKYSNGQVTTIKAILNNTIEKELKVVVDINRIDLVSLQVSNKVSSIYASQKYTPKVIYNPSDTFYKGYSISSSNTAVAKVQGTTIVGVKKGVTTITIKSTGNKNISSSFELDVLEQPKVSDFSYSCNNELVVGTSTNIKISNVKPAYASTSSIKYRSLNENIATVINGKVTGVAVGTTKIEIYSEDNSFTTKTINISVINKVVLEDNVIDLNITYLKGEEPAVFANTIIDLSSYFSVEFVTSDNKEAVYKNISYEICENYEQNGSITNSSLVINKPGHMDVYIKHNSSGISKVVCINAIDDFDLVAVNGQLENTMYFGNELKVKIQDNSNELQQYLIESEEEILNVESIDDYYLLKGKDVGSYKIKVTPVYDNVSYDNLSKVYTFNIVHKYIEVLDFSIFDTVNNKNVEVSNGQISIYINDKLMINDIYSSDVTKVDIHYEVENENILVIKSNGEIIPKRIGITKVIVKDFITNLSKEFTVRVRNNIILNDENSISLTGKDVKYDKETDVYSLTNGHSGNITINFDESSTYTDVKYHSSNDDVISIGSDGVLTPHKEGRSVITLVCDDGDTRIEYKVNIEVKRQDLIKDLGAFFYKIRKAIGHFGAFLVYGIFSTLTFLLYFRNKKWFFSVPLNIITGVGLAALTEYIQTFVPGRYGALSDVLIDCSGFMCSAIGTTLIILIIYLIKYLKGKKVVK